MAFNKIGGVAISRPVFSVALPSGSPFLLPGGQGTTGTYNAQNGNVVQTGQPLTGQYLLNLGAASSLQVLDPASTRWMTVANGPNVGLPCSSDNASFRLVNTTGCPVSGTITNAGSGLTNGYNTVSVTASAGGSTWNTLVGGAINSTITITSGGSGYTQPPILAFDPPANQGSAPYILPTATCTISGGAVNAVTVVNAGAGLVSAPTVRVIPAQGDTTGGGAVLTVNATLAGSGTLTAIWPAIYGAALGTAPTLSFSPASTIAVTAVLNGTGATDTVEITSL